MVTIQAQHLKEKKKHRMHMAYTCLVLQNGHADIVGHDMSHGHMMNSLEISLT